MEVVVQMCVRYSNRNDSVLAGKSSVVDILRSPSISTGKTYSNSAVISWFGIVGGNQLQSEIICGPSYSINVYS